MGPKEFVSKGNISNILEDATVLLDKLMFVVVGARDFSPEITELPIGTEVPCSDRVLPQIPIYRALYSIFGTRVPEQKIRSAAGGCRADSVIAPVGIEPTSEVPETSVLSIERRGRRVQRILPQCAPIVK